MLLLVEHHLTLALLSPLLKTQQSIDVDGARMLVFNDNLLVGPSTLSARGQSALRASYWGRRPRSPTLGPAAALEIWLTREWHSIVQLWRVSSECQRRGVHPELRIFGARSREQTVPGSDPPARTAGEVGPWIRGGRQRPARSALARWAELWARFCASAPDSFVEGSKQHDRTFPEIVGIGQYVMGFFPRVRGRRLALSRFDELLLGALDTEWASPARIYARALGAGSQLARWTERSGDRLVAHRLQEWALHPSSRIESRLIDESRSPMAGTAYRLTRSLSPVATIRGLEDAPVLRIGGATAYHGQGWVVSIRNGACSIGRL